MDRCLSQMPNSGYQCELEPGHYPETQHYAALSDGSFYNWNVDVANTDASLKFTGVPKQQTPTEVRVVDPETGAAKGVKIERHDLIPTGALAELAVHYGKGEAKYPSEDGIPNWRKGYAWSQSYAALQRHLRAFWEGEDYDEETGSKHLIAAAWHCFTLATYMDEQPEKDDRFSTVMKNIKQPQD